MNRRPTPETDDLARGNHVVPTEFAQGLERERDEARERVKDLAAEVHRLECKADDWKARLIQLNRETKRRENSLIVERGKLNSKLTAERALADRLVEVVEHSAKIIGPPDGEHESRWVTDDELDDLWDRTQSAIAARKEARSE